MTNVTEEYLSALYVNLDGLLWVGGHANGFGPVGYTTPEAAARGAAQLSGLNGAGVYHRGTPLSRRLGSDDGRGRSADSSAVYFYAVDADVVGPGHKAGNLPPDREAVAAAVASSGFPEPTTWVSSGGGFYPQWWLAEPVDVRHPDDLARMQGAFARLQGHLAAVWGDRGWKLDPTADLARVWRLPGTVNRKVPTTPVPCTWEGDSGRRYHLDDLLAHASRTPAQRPVASPTASGTGSGTPWEISRARAEIEKWAGLVTRDAFDAGDFNNTLNASAVRIGRFVPAVGTLEQAREMLAERCARIWGSADGSDLATIESGLRAGMRDSYRVVADIPRIMTGLPASAIPPVPGAPAPALDLDTLVITLDGILDATERRRHARESLRPVILALSPQDRQEWRDRLKSCAGLTYSDFDSLLRDAKRLDRNARLSAAQEGAVELPQPDAPLNVARRLIELDADVNRRHWRDDFYTWTGSAYRVTATADIRTWVYEQTEHATYTVEGKEGPETKRWLPTAHKVSQVIDALAHGAIARATDDDQEECIALTNGVLDPATRTLLPHTPDRFNLTSLPYAYQPGAPCPRWLTFLAEVLPPDSVRFLRQWAGYLVSGRTDQHKIASLVGASRSGKGTIARVLTALIGPANVTGPVLASLTGPFGLEPLLGRSLAVFGDVKWSAKGVPDATELLKTISGGDHISVGRKNKLAWEGLLPTRFMTLSNNTPTFTDSSGALAGRMIHVHFTRTFAGRENVALTSELLTELPGILLWALDGLDDLSILGRFTVPAASAAIDDEVRLASAPHGVFVAECCDLDPRATVPLDVAWMAWLTWCAGEGAEPGNKRWFARNLKDSQPSVGTDRRQEAGQKVKYLTGLSLRLSPALAVVAPFPAPVHQAFAGM